VTLSVEAQLDALMYEALAVEPIGEAELGEQVNRSLLEDAGADSLLDVLAAAVLEDDAIDALTLQEV